MTSSSFKFGNLPLSPAHDEENRQLKKTTDLFPFYLSAKEYSKNLSDTIYKYLYESHHLTPN